MQEKQCFHDSWTSHSSSFSYWDISHSGYTGGPTARNNKKPLNFLSNISGVDTGGGGGSRVSKTKFIIISAFKTFFKNFTKVKFYSTRLTEFGYIMIKTVK